MEPGLAIDFELVLKFPADVDERRGIPLDYVTVAMKTINKFAYAQEMADFKASASFFRDSNPVLVDAVENRLRAFKKQSLVRIKSVRQGSLVFDIATSGL